MGDFNSANYSDDFIADLVTFVAADDFQSMFENFFIQHAMEFSYDAEHKLKYYEIYQEFHGMFESQLESFCKRRNISQADFMTRCRSARESDPKAKHYIDILLSSVEYETFVKLMRIMRPVAESRLAAQADAKGTPSKDKSGESKGGAIARMSSGESPSKAAAKGGGDEDDGEVAAEPAMSKRGADDNDDDIADTKSHKDVSSSK
jgi:hypothetical protein